MEMCQDCLRDAPYSRPHLIKDCLIRSVAFCTHCCKSGHFSVDCSYHIKELKGEKVDSHSMPIVRTEHRLPKETKAIRAFCTTHSLSVLQDMNKNVKAIEKFCKENKMPFTWVEIPADAGEVKVKKSMKKAGNATKHTTSKKEVESEGI